ncbi:TlpA disulfide reductase family protein [uncultured Tessaracoccus sp.]|uniref:TlpA family protein disulfide reductase n=1 Tax=uncultured Tessaracoccus sp. TaxID=905023 RepID=UPI00262863B3|nr:TlpA disulfide reductase family protein [uncultured Tessaracoccus sp.]
MRRAIASGVAVFLLAACSPAQPDERADDGAAGFTIGDGTVTILEPAQRPDAPTLEGPSLMQEGERISTEDFAGKVVVVNVWGSWCAPCRHEAPELVEAYERVGEGVEFLGLNTRDLTPAPAQAFVRTAGITYPNIFDPDGALLLGFGQLPPKAIPSTLVIDSDGKVAARVIGEVDANTLVALVGDVQ